MRSRREALKGVRATALYRLLYIMVLSFGGVGVAVFFFGAYIGWGWTPSGSAQANASLALAILAVVAYLGFLLLLTPVRPRDLEG